MKKLSFLAIGFVAIVLAACGGKGTDQKADAPEAEKTFEQEQIEASIKMHIDSIANDIGQLKQFPFVQEGTDFALTKEEKQVKPDYLLNPAVADEVSTLAEKYRILSALSVDRKIASLYEMPVEEYDKAIAKLSADINDPSFKVLDNANSIFESTSALYDAMNENGRINYFWQIASAALVEQLFVINQNSEKFLSVFDDKAASDVTFRIVLILDAVNQLTTYDPEIKPVADALASLESLNAVDLNDLKKQLAESKEKIDAARKALIK